MWNVYFAIEWTFQLIGSGSKAIPSSCYTYRALTISQITENYLISYFFPGPGPMGMHTWSWTITSPTGCSTFWTNGSISRFHLTSPRRYLAKQVKTLFPCLDHIWAVTLASLNHRDLFEFLSFNTSLNIATTILKVSIPVSISYSLDSSLNIKTQDMRVLIAFLISRISIPV